MMKKKSKAKWMSVVLCLVLMPLMAGCMGPKGTTIPEKRAHVMNVHDETLQELYTQKPEVKSRVQKAAGYGVFNNLGSKIFVLATGSGFGVVVNNRTGEKTYMRMGEVGLGLGFGVKDFRAVFVFHNQDSLNQFITSGWQFGGEAEAAAKSGEKGGAATVAENIEQGVEVYQFTEAGVALSATVSGTKYWRDEELNE